MIPLALDRLVGVSAAGVVEAGDVELLALYVVVVVVMVETLLIRSS